MYKVVIADDEKIIQEHKSVLFGTPNRQESPRGSLGPLLNHFAK